MPTLEISQKGRVREAYGVKTANRWSHWQNGTLTGLANGSSGFSKDKLVVFRDGRPKYRLKETGRLNWAARSGMWLGIFLCFLLFAGKGGAYMLLLLLLILLYRCCCRLAFAPEYTIFDEDGKAGASRRKEAGAAYCFVFREDEYCIFHHKGEQFSLHKNGRQVALFSRKLINSRSRWRILYAAGEPEELLALFCLWLDWQVYTMRASAGRAGMGGITIRPSVVVKTAPFSDAHPEYALWQPEDIAAQAAAKG